ncbi:MAG: hypothetical protein ACM35H_01010 [Bacteroidota bacterium]|nr:hypothetical protein [Kiloniellaceae bacterium]
MYIWRNLPEGQLLAVLRWFQARREAGQTAADGKATKDGGRAVSTATTPPR